MRYLITGASGMLGRDLQTALGGREVTAMSRQDLDVTDLASVRAAVAGHDVVINAAAYTRVDDAEAHEDAAYAVNATGAANLGTASAEYGARLVQISTDYVFRGSADRPYAEDEPFDPLSAYGRTKAEGERLARAANPEGTFVVRTAWLYGAHGPNFAKTMLRLAATKQTWGVVADQVGQPTWTADLADQVVALLDADAAAGVYHGTSSGQTSWFGFAQAVLEECGLDPERISPIDSSQFPTPAPRPSYSVLGHDAWAKAGLRPIRSWRDGLSAAAAAGVLEAR